jgi:DNA-binding response OmpR family regulator
LSPMSVPVQNMSGKRENTALDVLVVDDDHPIRNLVRQIVGRLEVPSREARDGQEAIEEMEKKSPDILILDLMMPRVSGWQVLEWMREQDLLDAVPVVVLTAVGSKKMAGLADYPIRAIIDKPFEITHLSKTIRTILDEVR